jgi:hypothetical protein
MSYPIVTKTVEVHGIELPWVRRKAYAPQKGIVLGRGTAFIPLTLLEEVAQRTIDDYLYGNMPPELDSEQQLALEQAKLAEKETRGGCHGTDKLRRWLNKALVQFDQSRR